MSADVAVGMMDGAYFTGRVEILKFFNNLFQLDLKKIEETCTGAVACQLADFIYPGSIPMHRVNWEAKSDYEYVQNYKLLQAAFDKNHVKRYVDVPKLIRGKYQDNLEFCQWLKAFHDQQTVLRDDYDPVAARSRGKGAKKLRKSSTSQPSSKPLRSSSRSTVSQNRSSSTRNVMRSSSTSTKKSSPRQPPKATTRRKPSTPNRNSSNRSSRKASNDNPAVQEKFAEKKQAESVVADAELLKKNVALIARNKELEKTTTAIEKERDFYFEKVRDVEILLQVFQAHQTQRKEVDDQSTGHIDKVVDNIFKVLYATSENKVFVDDDGNLIEEGAVLNTTVEESREDEIFSPISSQSPDISDVNTAAYDSANRTDDNLDSAETEETSFVPSSVMSPTSSTVQSSCEDEIDEPATDSSPDTVPFPPQTLVVEEEEMF